MCSFAVYFFIIGRAGGGGRWNRSAIDERGGGGRYVGGLFYRSLWGSRGTAGSEGQYISGRVCVFGCACFFAATGLAFPTSRFFLRLLPSIIKLLPDFCFVWGSSISRSSSSRGWPSFGWYIELPLMRSVCTISNYHFPPSLSSNRIVARVRSLPFGACPPVEEM